MVIALERRANVRPLKLARNGVGYDYPASAGLVVALDGVDALTRTHPNWRGVSTFGSAAGTRRRRPRVCAKYCPTNEPVGYPGQTFRVVAAIHR